MNGKENSETEISKPAILVNAEHPLILLYADSEVAFFVDSSKQGWTFVVNKNELRPSVTSDFHPIHLQDLETGKMPKADPEFRKNFSNVEDAGIFVKKNLYSLRLQGLQETAADQRTSPETMNLVREVIPKITEFIEAANLLESTTDEKIKSKLRAACGSLLQKLETDETS